MKRHVLLTVAVLAILAQPALAWGPPWASDSQAWGPQCTTCIATGTTPAGMGTGSVATGQQQGATPLYLGLGYGDGTQPMPRDGTGFGSPW
ncbi:MAG: hypothetical protein HY795_06135 [Desulfovibrio sp.]|nr:hypothetical protein [Desulfovibrio sp.]MBI4961323.1 hypothetical protein [Desulfovibrio sp.]